MAAALSGQVLAVAAVLFGVRVALASRMRTLVSLPDEIGYLGDAWLIGRGRPAPPMLFAPVYKVGYPLLLAPAARLFDDPDRLRFFALVLNAVLLAALFPALVGLVGRLDPVGRSVRVGVALAAACLPATWVAGVIAWPDALAMVGVVWTLLALWALATPGRWWRRIWFGPAVAWMWVTHDRFLPALGLAVAVLVVRLVWLPLRTGDELDESRRERTLARRLNGLNLFGLGLVAIGGWTLNRWVVSVRWGLTFGGVIDDLRIGDIGNVARGLLGQGWYLICSTYGLAAIGVVSLGGRAWAAARRGRALWTEPGRARIGLRRSTHGLGRAGGGPSSCDRPSRSTWWPMAAIRTW